MKTAFDEARTAYRRLARQRGQIREEYIRLNKMLLKKCGACFAGKAKDVPTAEQLAQWDALRQKLVDIDQRFSRLLHDTFEPEDVGVGEISDAVRQIIKAAAAR